MKTSSQRFSLRFIADVFVRTSLVQPIPEIYARCIELEHPDLEFYLFDRLLKILIQYLKNEENMVSGRRRRLD